MKYESFSSHPYNDQNGEQITSYFDSDGNRIYGATVGYGHLITSESEFNKYSNGISLEQARNLFSTDLVSIIRLVKNYLCVDLTQNEFDAIVMLSFNIGPGSPDPYHRRRSHNGLYYSKVLKIINGQSTDDLDKAWMGYSHAHHHVVQGLLNRRRSELNVYHKGIYIKL